MEAIERRALYRGQAIENREQSDGVSSTGGFHFSGEGVESRHCRVLTVFPKGWLMY